jgi:Domain of unknown function (DUF4249)
MIRFNYISEKTKFCLMVLSLSLTLFACEEDINLNVAEGEKKLVIEGIIENNEYAEVSITRNSALTEAVNFASILVTNALAIVSDGAQNDTLKLDTVFTAANPFVYRGSKIKGQIGGTYYLTVIADGKTITGQTTIPSPVSLDSVWWQPQPPRDSLGFAWAKISEPAGLGNCYRWYAKRPMLFLGFNEPIPVINRRYVAPFGASFDDKFVDGRTFDFFYNRGYDATEASYWDDEPRNQRGFYKLTDTIYIKFCTIDRASYTYYITVDQTLSSNGNPFASPSQVINNLSGKALGGWCGQAATFDTIYPKP